MNERQDLIKAIVGAVGPLIKAEHETLKTVLLAEVKAVKTGLEKRMDTLETKVERVEKRMEAMETKIDQVETCMQAVEMKLEKVAAKLDDTLDDHATRIDQLETTAFPHSQ